MLICNFIIKNTFSIKFVNHFHLTTFYSVPSVPLFASASASLSSVPAPLLFGIFRCAFVCLCCAVRLCCVCKCAHLFTSHLFVVCCGSVYYKSWFGSQLHVNIITASYYCSGEPVVAATQPKPPAHVAETETSAGNGPSLSANQLARHYADRCEPWGSYTVRLGC